jgi:hypothetical protein
LKQIAWRDIRPFREVQLSGTAENFCRKGGALMKKDLRVTVAALAAMESQPDIRPEQRKAIKIARLKLKELARIKDPNRDEVFETIREICEKLLAAVRKRQ